MIATTFRIETDDLERPEVHALLAAHLDDMYATSPADSVHALDLSALRRPDVTFWTAWSDDDLRVGLPGTLLGCGALKHLADDHGEVKTMRTAPGARGRGVASRVLAHIVTEARKRGYARLSLETGSQPFFEPARRLYVKHGFVACPPFGDYQLDPNSVFLTRSIRPTGRSQRGA